MKRFFRGATIVGSDPNSGDRWNQSLMKRMLMVVNAQSEQQHLNVHLQICTLYKESEVRQVDFCRTPPPRLPLFNSLRTCDAPHLLFQPRPPQVCNFNLFSINVTVENFFG